jgi:thiosulfate dehydrogenase [quinone] large subunit
MLRMVASDTILHPMADSTSTTTPAPAADSPSFFSTCHLTAAFLLLRLWMGMRLITSGIEKFGYTGKDPTFSLDKWFGADRAAHEGLGDGKMWQISTAMTDYTWMAKYPAMVKLFMTGLPFAMLGLGVLILLGFLNRLAWWGAGLLWFSLAFGQMLLPDEQTVLYLTMYMFICALALTLINYNRVRLTKF